MTAAPRLVERAPARFLFHLRSTLPAVRREASLVARAQADPAFRWRLVDERVVALVRHAHALVPFYRRAYDRALVDSVRGAEDLPLLPTVDRRAVQNKYRFVAADTGPERCFPCRTSGSTGEPVVVLKDVEAFYHEQATFQRLYRRFGARSRYGPLRTSSVVLLPTARPRSQRQPTMGFSKAYRFGLGEPAWDDPLDPLRFLAARPGILLSASPNMLLELLRHSREHDPSRRYEVRPGLVLSGGGPLNDATRRTVGEFFSCPVVDVYGAEEVGLIAVECPAHDVFHVEAPACVVECVRADGAPAGPGEEGELLVTALRSRSFPLIRYRVGDTGSMLDGPCECGSSLPRLGGLIGRGGTVFLHRSGTAVLPAGMGHALVGLPVTQHQIEQLAIDRFVFRYVRVPGAHESEIRDRALALFVAIFGPQVDVTLIESAQLGEHGGKVEPYVNRLTPSRPATTSNASREA